MQLFFRHALASAATTVVLVALALVAYFGLLAWAVVAGLPLGGPLALPGMIAAACIVGALAALLLAPLTAGTEWFRKSRSLPLPFEIPAATLLTLLCVFALAQSLSAATLVVAGASLFVLGVYWWSLQAATLAFWLGCRFRSLWSPE